MAEYTANEVQLVQPNQGVAFSDTVIDGCKLIYHRPGSTLIKLYPNQNVCDCKGTKFFVAFSGNIAVPTDETVGEIQLSITLDGEAVPATAMIVTPRVVDAYFNVAGFINVYVKKPCCSSITIRNTSTIPINVQNANIIVKVA